MKIQYTPLGAEKPIVVDVDVEEVYVYVDAPEIEGVQRHYKLTDEGLVVDAWDNNDNCIGSAWFEHSSLLDLDEEIAPGSFGED